MSTSRLDSGDAKDFPINSIPVSSSLSLLIAIGKSTRLDLNLSQLEDAWPLGLPCWQLLLRSPVVSAGPLTAALLLSHQAFGFASHREVREPGVHLPSSCQTCLGLLRAESRFLIHRTRELSLKFLGSPKLM
jgi:hypothetical protein